MKNVACGPEESAFFGLRVTGFSGYFARLSPELRQFVVDRMLRDGA